MMGIEQLLAKESKKINREINKLLPKTLSKRWLNFALGKSDYAYDSATATEAISRPLRDLIDRGGKRWRPSLMLLCNAAVGGNPKKALPFSVITELVHTGTIIVDDVEDSSRMRRGKLCLHHKFGEDIAINAGNTLYYLPLLPLLRNRPRLGTKTKARVYGLVTEEMLRLSFGQGMDIYWHRGGKKKVSEKEYLQMCDYKTGTLARLSAKLGVILANGSRRQEEVLGRFAGRIGVAFQIQDDILNLKPGRRWGKTIGDDISEGKRTIISLHAMRKLPKKDARKLEAILNSHTTSKAKIRQAIALMDSTDSFDYARGVARKMVESSWKEANRLLKPSPAKANLKLFADYLIERNI